MKAVNTTIVFILLYVVPFIQALLTCRPQLPGTVGSNCRLLPAPHNSRVALWAATQHHRKPFITGNWKMNPTTIQEAVDLASGVAAAVTPESPGDVAIFVPYPFIEAVQRTVGDRLLVGAEAVIPYKNGAFTAGVSPTMLKSMNVDWCLAGHSERRALYNEDDNNINLQVKLLIEMEINVILCIGESADEYENQLARAVCEVQLRKGLSGVTADQMKFVTIAYEPVWAIGTGKVATPEIAQNIHSVCRDILRDMYGSEIADSTRILYGGSVSPDSVDGLMSKPDIDGALVGGASLKAESFGRIINFVPAKQAEYA